MMASFEILVKSGALVNIPLEENGGVSNLYKIIKSDNQQYDTTRRTKATRTIITATPSSI